MKIKAQCNGHDGEVRFPCDKCNWENMLEPLYFSIHTQSTDEVLEARHKAVLARLKVFINNIIN